MIIIRRYTHPNLYKVIDKYWPGPLTVIVPARHEGETIGIRMPDHTVALRLVEESGCTIAAPSANLEGKKPPTNCQEALEDLDGQVDLALDGGPVDFGISSTILDFTQDASDRHAGWGHHPAGCGPDHQQEMCFICVHGKQLPFGHGGIFA